MAKIDKARYWTAVLYPENMKQDWQETIGDVVQQPYAYCIHKLDKDKKSEHRKDHVHIILAFPNTTTYNHAMSVFDLLSAEGKKALNKIEAVIGIRNVYDYLIHDTDACRKNGKELYPKEARITGNNFDIGAYEQLGAAEKHAMFLELSEDIREYGFTNYMDFYIYVVDTYEDINYIEIFRTYSSHFERLTRANFQRWEMSQRGEEPPLKKDPSHRKHHKNTTSSTTSSTTSTTSSTTSTTSSTTETPPICCPECGSVDIKKRGKTLAGRQRWECKECEKTFVGEREESHSFQELRPEKNVTEDGRQTDTDERSNP